MVNCFFTVAPFDLKKCKCLAISGLSNAKFFRFLSEPYLGKIGQNIFCNFKQYCLHIFDSKKTHTLALETLAFFKKFHFLYLLICSIHAALMLAYFGAGGVTEQELSKVLGKKCALKKLGLDRAGNFPALGLSGQ